MSRPKKKAETKLKSYLTSLSQYSTIYKKVKIKMFKNLIAKTGKIFKNCQY